MGEDIIINGTVVRVGQVWQDDEGDVELITELCPHAEHYPIETARENYSRKGWLTKSNNGNRDCPHLVRCIYDPNAEPAPAVNSGRKVVQISSWISGTDVLLEDGSIWSYNSRADIWSKLPPIPQDENESKQEEHQ